MLGNRKVGAGGRFQQSTILVEPVILPVTDFQGEHFLFDDSTQDSVPKISDSNDMLHSSDTLPDYVSQITSSISIRFRRFCNLSMINSAVEHIQDSFPIQDSSLTTSLSASGSFFSFVKRSYAFQRSEPTAQWFYCLCRWFNQRFCSRQSFSVCSRQSFSVLIRILHWQLLSPVMRPVR